MPPSPSRGEVWLVDLGLAAKMRPCLILGRGTGERRAYWVQAAETRPQTRTRCESCHLSPEFGLEFRSIKSDFPRLHRLQSV